MDSWAWRGEEREREQCKRSVRPPALRAMHHWVFGDAKKPWIVVTDPRLELGTSRGLLLGFSIVRRM
jgi:hypothetical protein